jgi:hypothetical protein
MPWTNNGLVWYGGERPINRTPQLQTTWEQVKQANSDMPHSSMLPAWDPMATRKQQNSQAQIAVAYAQHHGIPITLTAAGDVREQPARPEEDARLTRALAGRTPPTAAALNEWLRESDGALATDQRIALTMEYEHAHGRLPSGVEETPATKTHTLGSLGLRKATKMTQAEFAERLRFHGVPQEDHLRLAMEAFQAGHILRDDEDQAMTFHPGSNMGHTFHPGSTLARQKTVAGIQANFAALAVLQGKKPAGGVRVGDMKASARDWEC